MVDLKRNARMNWIGCLAVVLALSVPTFTSVSFAAHVRAEPQAAGAPAGQGGQGGQTQAQPLVTRIFTSDAGMVLNFIKPDRTADFEEVMGKLKEALEKSDKPERKQQADTWKVFRALEPGANGSVLYVFEIDPAVPGADYTVSTILAEAFPEQVQDLYKKYADAYVSGQNFVNLKLVSALGQ